MLHRKQSRGMLVARRKKQTIYVSAASTYSWSVFRCVTFGVAKVFVLPVMVFMDKYPETGHRHRQSGLFNGPTPPECNLHQHPLHGSPQYHLNLPWPLTYVTHVSQPWNSGPREHAHAFPACISATEPLRARAHQRRSPSRIWPCDHGLSEWKLRQPEVFWAG